MKVFILATCRKPELMQGMMMVFDTVRVGFPDAQIEVGWNYRESTKESWEPLCRRCNDVKARVFPFIAQDGFAHPEWIAHVMNTVDGKYAIIDTDMVFYANCENFGFDTSVHIAGVWVPKFYCPFVQAITMPRVHTSFVLVPDGAHLRKAIDNVVELDTPMSVMRLMKPFVYVHDGKRYFQDTMGGLSQVVGCGHFEQRHLDCYDHLHNGTIIDQVADKHPNGGQLQERVQRAYAQPESIKDSWPGYARYYEERRVE